MPTIDFTGARLVDRGLEAIDDDGARRDRTPAERFELPALSEASRSRQPVLLYFYLQEDEDDPSTRHPNCRKFEDRLFRGQAALTEAAAGCLRIEVNARSVPRDFLRLWKVSSAPTLYVLDHEGTPRFRYTSASTSPTAVLQAIAKVQAHAARDVDNE